MDMFWMEKSREVDLTYRDQNTPVVTYDEDWQNNRQKAKVTVVKKKKIQTVFWKAEYLHFIQRMIF